MIAKVNSIFAILTLAGVEDQMSMLETLIEGRRLRDISDLPFDLLI
ncbi:MAG: NgoMIV family type II restriction endonuclease [Chloroflexota bacterium]